MTKGVRVWVWFFVLMLLASGAVTAQGRGRERRGGQRGKKNSPPKVGEVAQDFTLSDTNGKKVKFSSFRDKKILVLEFGACT